MKPLLLTILTLFCLSVSGQQVISPMDTTLYMNAYSFFDTTPTISMADNHLTIRDVVTLWDEYAKECWNDSTKDELDDVVFFNQKTVHFERVHNYYYHRDPTLDGFMEFIKLKYKCPGRAL